MSFGTLLCVCFTYPLISVRRQAFALHRSWVNFGSAWHGQVRVTYTDWVNSVDRRTKTKRISIGSRRGLSGASFRPSYAVRNTFSTSCCFHLATFMQSFSWRLKCILMSLQSITCHMESQVLAATQRVNISQGGWYSVYLPLRDEGWVDLGVGHNTVSTGWSKKTAQS